MKRILSANRCLFMCALVMSMSVWTGAARAQDQGGGTAAEQPQSVVGKNDRKLLDRIARENLEAQHLATLAARQAQIAEVRTLAQRIGEDQRRLAGELSQLGRDKGVTLPTSMASATVKELDKLSKQAGIAFDRQAIDEIVEIHKELLQELQSAAKDGQDPQLKQWAMKTVPTVQTDLSSAQSIKQTVDSLQK